MEEYDITTLSKTVKVRCSCGHLLTPVQIISKGAYYMWVWNCIKCQKKRDMAQHETMLEDAIKMRLR